MSEIIHFNMTAVQEGLCKSAMAGEPGKELLYVVAYNIVLSDQLSAEESKGAGKVLKLLMALHNDTDNLVKSPTKTE